ncbi:Trp biosynthesis-associated membrane protein [Cellulomonas aerilata]|uniref:Tryptophan-associated transmembrane protein n=1 Tax=Cellulomonas aerilata TaxID=515326 RepID=A0A512DFZ3_9CELL|nr:Trp biosynthesis-associated membrane protein [Cellulomonas aerilata]GEO35408.1 hypothetical protein CAE01nite_31330 [Cellulomonas aerilata]
MSGATSAGRTHHGPHRDGPHGDGHRNGDGDGLPDDRGAEPARTGRRRAILTVLALALVTLLSSVPVWLRTAGTTALQGDVPVTVTGTQAAPGIPAAALVLLSAGIAIGLVGRAGRWVLVGAVALSGVLATVSAVLVAAGPDDVARTAVAAATGVDTLAEPVALSPWPYVAAVVGLVVLAAAGWLASTSGTWARPSARHDVAAGPAAVPDDDQAAWDALSRGQDPS